ncbi:MAG: apolipoprotein N-acyltransferase [Acidimicrobiales bacterium]
MALPGAWLVAEAFRGAWPFGGVPLSTLAVGQVGGPLAPIARIGGTLLIAAATIGAGLALASLLTRHWRSAGAALATVMLALGVAALAPRGESTGRSLSVAYVQGGGPQGTSSSTTDPRVVFERHLAASRRVPVGLDLTLWPEDVVDTGTGVLDTKEGKELAALARRLDTTLVAGVVEDDVDPTLFRNASVAWDPDGRPIDRYDKVQRVPFGEFVPFRSLLERFAGDSLPGRDAAKGQGPATLDTPVGRLGVVISWEVFFGHRARDAVRNGGEVLINPTNGSSFTRTLVQTQQVASSRLRAIETGRWLVQAAPTGFSAFVTPDGRVLERTAVGEQAVAVHQVGLRRGLTLYSRWGDRPVIFLGLALTATGWLAARRQQG